MEQCELYQNDLNDLTGLNIRLYDFLKTLDKINIPKSAIAYLTTMAIRIHYMHKVLKDSGSFYLHCDPTMSHYLKLVCDLIFSEKNFVSEIIWSNETASGFKTQIKTKYIRGHDIILFYSLKNPTFNIQYFPLIPATIKRYDKLDSDGRYYKIYYDGGGKKRKVYLDKSKGRKISDTWTDLPSFQTVNASREWMGYPTQKPMALMERIIKASSNEGDLVADFFCGCGTTIAAANKLNRKWIGCDISHLAIKLVLKRLTDPIAEDKRKKFLNTIEIHGFPKDIASAKLLAKSDELLEKKSKKGAFDFQHWIVEVKLDGIRNPKDIADGGWDGYLIYPKSEKEHGRVLIEVKSGNVNVKNIREFIRVVDREEADIGVFVCFAEQLTGPMVHAAKEVGNVKDFKRIDRIQILTVEDLFDEREVKIPGLGESIIFKQSIKDIRPDRGNDKGLFD